MTTRIIDVRGFLRKRDDVALKSTSNAGRTVWFAMFDGTLYASRNGDTYEIDRRTVQRNLEHEDTTVERLSIEDSPFDAPDE